MDQGPLVSEEIGAGAELVRGFDKYKPVKVAFWLKASDENQRYLYISSNQIDDTNLELAYGEVLRLAGEMHNPYLDPFRVKVISGEDPLAQAATDIQKRFPATIPTRFHGTSFGGIWVDDVYIYPPPLAASVS